MRGKISGEKDTQFITKACFKYLNDCSKTSCNYSFPIDLAPNELEKCNYSFLIDLATN